MTDIQTAYAILNKIAGRSSEAAAYKSWSHVFARQEITIAWENTEGTFNKPWPKINLKNLMKAGHKTLFNLGFRKWDESGLYLIPLWIINYYSEQARRWWHYQPMRRIIMMQRNLYQAMCRSKVLAQRYKKGQSQCTIQSTIPNPLPKPLTR